MEFYSKDKRIFCFRQGENKGLNYNINFVLEKASGKYFMWAADDDTFDIHYIRKCVDYLEREKNYVAVTTEAQYFSDDKMFDFFKEGEAFYFFNSQNSKKRISYLLRYNYGNLFYSVYLRSVLFRSGKTLFLI